MTGYSGIFHPCRPICIPSIYFHVHPLVRKEEPWNSFYWANFRRKTPEWIIHLIPGVLGAWIQGHEFNRTKRDAAVLVVHLPFLQTALSGIATPSSTVTPVTIPGRLPLIISSFLSNDVICTMTHLSVRPSFVLQWGFHLPPPQVHLWDFALWLYVCVSVNGCLLWPWTSDLATGPAQTLAVSSKSSRVKQKSQ